MTTDGIRWGRLAILLCAAVILYLLGRWVSEDLVRHFGPLVQPHNEALLHRMIMTATVIYIVLLVTPFMPAAEIGFSMLVIFGGKIAFLVYVSTVVALTIGYGLGRLLPAEFTVKLFGLLGLARAQRFVRRLGPLSGRERLALLERESPVRLARHAIRHRYAVLALLLNVPGNVVIGGGGGIALLAGMTRLFRFPAYLIAVALAVAPVPLIVFLTD
jgi:hypothetical protein